MQKPPFHLRIHNHSRESSLLQGGVHTAKQVSMKTGMNTTNTMVSKQTSYYGLGGFKS